MLTILQTDEFDGWLRRLKDPIAIARIVARLRSAQYGNFGDCKSVAPGISEMRIHVGPGYRLYYARKESVIYVMLCGGSKSSQTRDIHRAVRILAQLGNLP
ncbi:MAG: addiction module protein [Pseudoxanthomonas suwonensis]|nr:MAG: addiction module protein [Pseudoxanthomonas suwonensis]